MATPFYIAPMLLTPSKVLPRGEQWLYELKFDGFRGVAVKDGDSVRLFSRNQTDLSRRFPRIIAGIALLLVRNCVLDGGNCLPGPERASMFRGSAKRSRRSRRAFAD